MKPQLIFEPLRLGQMTVRNRIAAPPHAAMLGALLGTEDEAERYISYWRTLAEGGTGYLIALNGFVENICPPGFDPQGVGSRKGGVFRSPLFVERMGRLAAEAQDRGARVGTQLIMQGGMPHGPSPTLSGPVINLVPHALTRREIAWFVAEYRFSAQQALAAGLDAIELHANHDDLIEWFLSPLTNRRSDGYGGSFEGRMAFLGEILAEIRAAVGDRLTVGVRLNMAEAEPGGYDADEGLRIAGWLQQTGHVDYIHCVMGTGWGFPSYIQPWHFRPGQWAEMAGAFKRQLDVPVIYGGRVNRPEVAEAILAAGHADMVAVGRAHLADAAFVAKAMGEDARPFRPCIGTNDCINRGVAEGLPFACTVNPALGLGDRTDLPRTEAPRNLLVIGGGPAGMQLAITARERGHRVELWEKDEELGGQVRLAAMLPGQAAFADLIRYQAARLEDLGVTVRLGQEATHDALARHEAGVIALATGASPRRPAIPGAEGAHVCDMWRYLKGEETVGRDVAIIVQDDHIAPLAFADMLAREGRRVTLFIQTNGPAPLVSRYSIGTLLGRLSEAGARLICMEAVTGIDLPIIRTRNVYSQRESLHDGFDSVVLACGGISNADLFTRLEETREDVHLLGDAYAPRRIVFATQQGYALAKQL
ncbi:oxidoreductase [Novosphingobium rosa]|uniref:oxidoreductase n=1 Tax=Novosphingobium rosa TaxID=76978 RepID=UPI0008368265|nr:FAD-dependent oxidoreductase [Novosphingobium rosa]